MGGNILHLSRKVLIMLKNHLIPPIVWTVSKPTNEVSMSDWWFLTKYEKCEICGSGIGKIDFDMSEHHYF